MNREQELTIDIEKAVDYLKEAYMEIEDIQDFIDRLEKDVKEWKEELDQLQQSKQKREDDWDRYYDLLIGN